MRIFTQSLIVTAGLSLAACEASSPGEISDPAEEAAEVVTLLDDRLDALQAEMGFVGATAAAVLPDGSIWLAASGMADREQAIEMETHHRMPAGSIGKTLVAAVAMELVLDGTFTMDMRVASVLGGEAWYDSLPNADTITLANLFNHETGIPMDYFMTDTVREYMRISAEEGIDLADQGVTPKMLMAPLGETEPAFAPGEAFNYTDANYALIGLMIEAVTGNTLEEEVSSRLLQPLSLEDTERQRRIMSEMTAGYIPVEQLRQIFPGVEEKAGEFGELYYDPRMEWGGGGWVFTASDLARWGDLWFSGEALEGEYVPLMYGGLSGKVPPQAGFDYGPGLQLRVHPDLGDLRFHNGFMGGFISKVEYVPELDVTVALLMNETDFRYEAIHAQLRDVVLNELSALDEPE